MFTYSTWGYLSTKEPGWKLLLLGRVGGAFGERSLVSSFPRQRLACLRSDVAWF